MTRRDRDRVKVMNKALRTGRRTALRGAFSGNRLRCVSLAAVAGVLIAGCALPGPPERTEVHTYRLEGRSGNPDLDSVSRPCVTLRVGSAGSAPGFNTSRMAYSRAPLQLGYFAYHTWADSPAKMLVALAETALDRSGLLGATVSGSLDVGTDLRLDLDGTELLQVFDGDVSEVRLSVKARLVDLSSHALLAVETFTYTEDGVPPNPAAGAAAADRAAARFLEDLQAFVAASLAGVDCPE